MPPKPKKQQKTSQPPDPPKIDSSLLAKHPYFQNTFAFLSNGERISCKTCKDGWTVNGVPPEDSKKYSFVKRWLPFHLTSRTHIRFEKDKTGLVEAAKMFNKTIDIESILLNETDSQEDEDFESMGDKEGIFSEISPSNSNDEEAKEPRDGVSKAADTKIVNKQNEINLTFDIAEFMIVKHLPFNSAPDILEFAQKIISKYSPELVNSVHTSSTTLTQVVSHCIGEPLKDKIFSKLTNSPFSILLDASSDLYGDNYMAVLVRYFDDPVLPPVTKFIAAIEIGASSTGEVLFEKLTDEMFNGKHDILKNVIAICTDSGTNMISTQGAGLTNHLQTLVPSLVHVKDLRHAYNKIAEEATKVFPKFAIDHMKEACSYVTRSTQRKIKFREFQLTKKKNLPSFKPNELKEVPCFKEVRWLSLSNVATYVSENWSDLEEFYQSQDLDIKNNFTKENRLYTDLLALLLKKLHYYTHYFQNGSHLMNHIVSEIKTSYNEFVAYLMKTPFDKPEKEKNYFDIVFPFPIEGPSDKLKSLTEFKEFFLGKFECFKAEIQELMTKKSTIELEFIKTAKDFITITVKEMRERLLFQNDIVMKSLIVYWPAEVEKSAWSSLAKLFPKILPNIHDIESELDRFCAAYGSLRPPQEKPLASKITETWANLDKQYPLITKLAQALMVLPYTSAEVESTFSRFKVFKSPYRNKLSTANLEASLLSEQFFGAQAFRILPEMYERYTTMWQEQKKKKVLNTRKSVNSEVQCDLRQNQVNSAINNDINDLKIDDFIQAFPQINALVSSQSSNSEVNNSQQLQIPFGKRNFLQNFMPLMNPEGIKKLKMTLDLISVLGIASNLKMEDNKELESSGQEIPKEESP